MRELKRFAVGLIVVAAFLALLVFAANFPTTTIIMLVPLVAWLIGKVILGDKKAGRA